MTSARLQSFQIRNRSTQKPRSTFESRGRFTERRRTATCCLNAKFSRLRARRVLKAERRERRKVEIMRGCCRPARGKIKCETHGLINRRDRITGGRLNDFTAAFNWYATKRFLTLFNAIRAKRSGIDPVWIFQIRLQVAF
jgi:hypothetical protein